LLHWNLTVAEFYTKTESCSAVARLKSLLYFKIYTSIFLVYYILYVYIVFEDFFKRFLQAGK